MKIWAHRGLSLRYPENTLLSFSKALEIKGLTGIEFDIQLTSDGYIVICHDETVNRTTNGIGNINAMTLKEIKKLKINSSNETFEKIPTIGEVLELVKEKADSKLMLNVELKNNIIHYEKMEEKIIRTIDDYGLKNNVIYSSFNIESVKRIKEIDSNAKTGILDFYISDCIEKAKKVNADALHPCFQGIDLPRASYNNYIVRAWGGGKLYPETPSNKTLNLVELENKGITDIFLNEPEKYVTF